MKFIPFWILNQIGCLRAFEKKKIHHIAIGTENPEILAAYYLKFPGARLERKIPGEGGKIRSIWIHFGDFRLFLEEGERQAPRALVFPFEEQDRQFWESFEHFKKTDYTVYGRDPDGNTVGVSSYPEEILLPVAASLP